MSVQPRPTALESTADSPSSDEEAYHSASEDDPVAEGRDKQGEAATGDRADTGEGGASRGEDGPAKGLGECISGLDNCCVSKDQEGRAASGERLSEEEIKELRERAAAAKLQGNDLFKNGDYNSAMECYSEALNLYPKSCDLKEGSCDLEEGSCDREEGSCDHERAVCFANRAACHMKKESHQDVIDDCTEALTLEPAYMKCLLRRAQAYEATEKYEEALEDYKKVVELDPSQVLARQAIVYLPDKIKEQHEKLKNEMFGKLKELGNAVLNPFGLSTDNFQLQQDPNSGGYSVNFKK